MYFFDSFYNEKYITGLKAKKYIFVELSKQFII